MPVYEIKAPDGRTYQIEGPEGASQEDIRREVLRQFPDAGSRQTRPLKTAGDHAADVATVTAKGTAKAAAGPFDFLNEIAGGVESGINFALTEGGGALLDLAGFDNAAERVRQAGQRRQEDITRTTDQLSVRNALDRTAPTPEGYELSEFGTELAAGLLLPTGAPSSASNVARTAQNALRQPQVVDDAARIVSEGQRRNVPVMTTDVRPPQSAMGRHVKQTIPEKIPVTGTSGPRQAQQQARQQAVVDLVEEFGGETGRALFDDADTLVQQVSRALTERRGTRLANLKSAKDSVIDSIDEPFTSAPNTVQAIQEQVRNLNDIDALEFAPVIERLQRFGEQVTSGKSLRNVEEQRRLLGELFADGSLAQIKGRGQQAINAIYDPLRKDMGDFIESTSGTAARARWKRANEGLASMAGELKSTAFKNVLRQADTTPEAVSRIMFGNAENTSDMRRLVENLEPSDLRKVQGALMTRAFERAGGADGVSVERFLSNLKQLSGKIGVAFKNDDRAALEGARRLLEATRRGGEASAIVRTGEQNLPAIMGIGATQALGFGGGVASLGVGGLLARVYESTATRNLLIRLSKTKSGSVAEGRITANLMKASVPIVNNWRDDALRAANNNAGALAAEEAVAEE